MGPAQGEKRPPLREVAMMIGSPPRSMLLAGAFLTVFTVAALAQ
jgi:hypothetical protein